ncbi:MAG: YbjQ family protein [Dehalococcoidia bacterium]|nr:YbjQ family protein [Dehalococcoidia bacterium]MYB48444.1 YbjQ family protein [Dehalococcoidia bacterium]
MIVTTTDAIPGATIVETLGLVRGSTVRARHIGRDIMAGLRNIVGGEVDEYTKLLAEAREESLQRMIESAEAMGGNAVVGTRFITAGVAQGAAEIVAYGTAVKTT